MLKKQNRINKKLFKVVFEEGKPFSSGHIFLKTKKTGGDNALFSFVAPLKVSKRAVVRNKLKRRGRYVAKKHLDLLKKGNATLVFFKKDSEKMKFADLEEEILKIFKKAKLI